MFAWYVGQVGPERIWEAVQRVGPFAPIILIPYLVVYVVDALAWAQVLPPKRPRFPSLLRIRWAGEAVNNLVPTAYIGGEAVKVGLLRAAGIDAATGTVAAVVSKTAQTVAQGCFVLAAAAAFCQTMPARPGLRTALWIVAGCGLAATGVFFWVQRAGLFALLLAGLRKIGCRPEAIERRRARLLEIDQTLADYYRLQPGHFWRSTGLYLAGWLLDTLEIYVVAYLLGWPMSWTQALIVEAFTGVAKAIGMWVPGSLGIQESGIVLMGRLVGLPDTLSATYALIRRARELIFAMTGLLLLSSGGKLRSTAGAKA